MRYLDKTELGESICLTNDKLSVWVAPSRGMNVERICYEGIELIDCDPLRAEQGATYAVPVLYPTPNRVEKGSFEFEGEQVQAQMHGVAYRSSFALVQSTTQQEEVTGQLSFEPGNPLYRQFPYASKLYVTVRLLDNGIRWEYTVKNLDAKPLGYGFALHPFFKKYPQTQYRVFAQSVMEMTGEKLPTGQTLPLQGKYAVEEEREVDAAALDDVFCVKTNPMASFFYPQFSLRGTIRTSNEFAKCVVFTPQGKPWFCIEPQTSATNCHNLHQKGWVQQANLQIVPPHSEQSGWVELVLQAQSSTGFAESHRKSTIVQTKSLKVY